MWRGDVPHARGLALPVLRLQDRLLRLVMTRLESHVVPSDPTFAANSAHMRQTVAELRSRIAEAQEGGGERYVQRHREQGKLPVRERIDRLIDAGSPFL